jgi:hypothetical protein
MTPDDQGIRYTEIFLIDRKERKRDGGRGE